jgi:FAD:protein FMN transferase
MYKIIEVSHQFRAMNTDVETVICMPDGESENGKKLLQRAETMFRVIENILSRFNPDSELSLLNASAGSPFKANSVLFEVVKAALEAARQTGGAFDPTLLDQLEAAGYDRSFEKTALPRTIPARQPPLRKYSWQNIHVDPACSTIYLPAGCRLDLGGIGKGWAVDQVSEILKYSSGFAVDAGGDIRVGGRQAGGDPWTIGVADPFHENSNLETVELKNGAVCTSTSQRRKWQMSGLWQHHIIDPSTGRPTLSEVVSASVLAPTAVQAETLAKAAIVLGPREGLELLERQPEVSGLLVLQDGKVLMSQGFPEVIHAY